MCRLSSARGALILCAAEDEVVLIADPDQRIEARSADGAQV
jgi:hypothetical protein